MQCGYRSHPLCPRAGWRGSGGLLTTSCLDQKSSPPGQNSVLPPNIQGAVCLNRARTDLCRGRSAMTVPTAITRCAFFESPW